MTISTNISSRLSPLDKFKEHQQVPEVGGRRSRRFLHWTDSVHRGADLLVFDGGQGGTRFRGGSSWKFGGVVPGRYHRWEWQETNLRF